MIARLVLLSVAVLLSGCAELNSIYRVRNIDNADARRAQARIVTVDAKQRHLLISPELTIANNSPEFVRWRMCAEAAPDVFSAYAASLAAKGDKSGGQLSFGGSETAATIERTQTVNLLRESMYRTCERFLSGALSKEQFIVQAARDQRSMVAVLAVEQLTGAIRAKPTIISGPATSASIIDGDKVAELVTQYTQEKKTAVEALATATGAFDTANAGVECDKTKDKPAATDQGKWDTCVEAKGIKGKREAELKIADERLQKVLDLAGKIATQINASTSAGTNQGEALGANRPGDLALVAAASAIVDIVRLTGVDEPLMFCLAYLQDGKKKDVDDPTLLKCLSILEIRAADDDKVRRQALILSDPVSARLFSAKGAMGAEFVKALGLQIAATNPTDLPRKIERFEQIAGTNLDLKAKCAATESCSKAVSVAKVELLRAYANSPEKMETALAGWSVE